MSLTRSKADAQEWIVTELGDRQGLHPVAIVPTTIQCCFTHNLHGPQEATGAELLNDTFAMLGNAREARPRLHLLPLAYDLKEMEGEDAKTP